MPKVSVIMPTYNQDCYLASSIKSVLNQTMGDLELIIVNDGSTDSTAEILSSITDRRVKVICQENKGPSAAMNYGFKESSGDYLTWLASDNFYKQRFLENTSQFLDSHPEIAMVYSPFENIDSEGNLIDYTFLESYYNGLLLVNPGAVGMAFLYRRGLYEKVGDYQDLICNDLDYWLRASRCFKFGFLPEVLGCNRKHPEMRTITQRETLLLQVDGLLEREINDTDGSPALSLIDCFTQLKRKSSEVIRVLRYRLRDYSKDSMLIVVGEDPLRDAVVAILRMGGFTVEGLAIERCLEVESDSLYIPLDERIELELRNNHKKVITMAPQNTTMFGRNF